MFLAAVAQEVAQCQAEKDLCQQDLDKAIPALRKAEAALAALRKEDITEVKNFKSPPEGVKLVMEAVCVLTETKAQATKIKQGAESVLVYDYWETVR